MLGNKFSKALGVYLKHLETEIPVQWKATSEAPALDTFPVFVLAVKGTQTKLVETFCEA